MLAPIALSAALLMAAPTSAGFDADRPMRGAHADTIQAAAKPPRGWTAFAECVEHRESRGIPTNVNGSSGAAGLFQFLPAWRSGLPYNVADRLRQHGVPDRIARSVRLHLSARPIHRWEPVYQRIGFADQLARPGGWRHWYLAGSRCQALVP